MLNIHGQWEKLRVLFKLQIKFLDIGIDSNSTFLEKNKEKKEERDYRVVLK